MRLNRLQKGPLSYRNAVLMALLVTIAVHLLTIIIFHYGREVMMPMGRGRHKPPASFDWMGFAIGFCYNFILVLILYLLNFRLLKSKLNNTPKLIIIILSTIVATIIMTYLLTYLQYELMGWKHKHPGRRNLGFIGMMMSGNMMKDLFLASVVVFSSQLIFLSSKKQQIALEYKTLMAENMRTRYEALKNQVDPHFLFNTLNTLKSIIRTDPPKAEEYTQELSQVLRYTLQNKDIISLDDELDFTKSYCSLMQIRYGESLNFDFKIDDNYKKYKIIPLSVQTLVENAIKHNVITNRSPLTISVYSLPNDTIVVSNKIQPKKEAEAGEQIGLANLAERYRLKWNRDIEIENDGEIFKVTIPLIELETEVTNI